MKKQRVISLLASVVMLFSVASPFAYASEDGAVLADGYKETTDTATVPLTSIDDEEVPDDVTVPQTVTDETEPEISSDLFNVTAENHEPQTYEAEESPYTYKVISEEKKTIVITGVNTALSGKVIIPSEIDGYTVVALGDAAFGRNGVLKNVTSVTVPDTVKRIESNNCFYDCKNIKEIILPEEMEYIGIGAFTGCSSLTSIVIPRGVTKLTKTFRRCTSLKTVTIPSTVTEIDSAAFATTDGGTDVLPGVTIKCAIGSYAARYAQSRGIKYKYSDGPLYLYSENSDGTITITDMADDVEIVGTLEIPQTIDGKTVTGIGEGAFKNREDIKSIVLPQMVTTIGEEAFANCKNISVFDIPYGVKVLDNTFTGCTSLSVVTIPETVTDISEDTFYTDYKSNGGVPVPNLMIYCIAGTAAENYARENSISYEAERILPDAWDGTVDISWYDENEDIYYISDASELAGLRELVNSGQELFYGKTVNLTNDINMEGTVWKIGIGYYTADVNDERKFNGIFDGNGFIIANFTYDSTAEKDTVADATIPDVASHRYHGLFGEIGMYGMVKNLGIENAKLTAGSLENKVATVAGIIAGVNRGEIKHCYINNACLAGGFYGSWCDHSYGGISGKNLGTTEDCFVKSLDFKGIVAQLNATRKGGITATNSGTIKDCYASTIIYDNVDGYFSWNEDGSGKDKCPIMFYYDPITSTNSGTVENVYSDDSFCRDGWNAGARKYEDFNLMNDKMKAAFEKLTFRTIEPTKVKIIVSKADGDMANITPDINLVFSQAAIAESINGDTFVIKYGEETLNTFEIISADDEKYPHSCTIKFDDQLQWQSEYEVYAEGLKDLWNREIEAVTAKFKTTGEIVCDSFELYENYGRANERKLTSANNVTGEVTAVIKGLKNNGKNNYNAVLSIGVLSDNQLIKGANKTVTISAGEQKQSPVFITTSSASGNVFIQGVLYKGVSNAVPLISSVQVGN